MENTYRFYTIVWVLGEDSCEVGASPFLLYEIKSVPLCTVSSEPGMVQQTPEFCLLV